MLIPPDNFGFVEPGIYRCSKLEADHLPFLETLQLLLLVFLDVAKPPRTLKAFLNDNKVTLYNLGGLKISNHQNTGPLDPTNDHEKKTGQEPGTLSNRDQVEIILMESTKQNNNDLWMIIEKNLIVAALGILLDRTKHNVLLVDSSLALIGILRKIQKWNFNSIVNEYRIYTGNSSKSSYGVEVFLEILQIELVPFELEQARRKHEGSNKLTPSTSRRVLQGIYGEENSLKTIPIRKTSSPELRIGDASPSSKTGNLDYRNPVHRLSIDDYPAARDEAIEEYEDDADDDMLSASPQIPATLLKLVEQRNNDGSVSPGTSPDYRKGSICGSRAGSLDILTANPRQRRKSSLDSRYIRTHNTRFRDPAFTLSLSPSRASLDSSLKQFKMGRNLPTQDELQRMKTRTSYRYYEPSLSGASSFNVISIKIPEESNLPEWFIKGRDFWENLYASQTH